MRRTRRVLLVVIPAALLVVAVALAFWSAQRTLARSAGLARTQHQLGFTLQPFDPAAAQARNSGFEPVNSPDAFTSGAFLSGDLYLAGSAGLSIYSQDGTLRRTLRTGFELPVAPIVTIACGHLRGVNEDQILLATAGAGILLLEPRPNAALLLHQLLPDSPDARDLTSLLPLPSGDLLLGTRHGGVLLYDGATLVPYAATADQAHEITTLAAADSTSILIGTRNAGLFYVHAGTVQHASAASGLPDDQIESIAVANGRAYAGTPLGVAQFDLNHSDGSVALKPERILAPGLFAHSLAPTASELLVGSLDQGIQRIPLGTHPRLRNAALGLEGESSGQRIDQFLAPAGPSAPLYALAGGSLLLRGEIGWHSALPPSSANLADRNISALAFAPDGALYIGFFDHGLDILSPTSSESIRHFEDDHLFCINRLALDPVRQTIAAATANGLVLFDRQGTPRQVLTRRDGLINNHVYTLGASHGDDRLLAGTLGGLSILEAGAVKRNFTASNSGLKHNWITALAATPEGGWLIGTYGAGLEILAPSGSFSPIELPAGAPRDLVINPNAILVTPSHVYAGTLGRGMLVRDNATGRWAVVTQGLPSLNVTAFAEREGELYVGTENGLVRIAEARLP